MSESKTTWVERAKEIVAEDWENEHDLYLKAEVIKYSPNSSIQLLNEFKEALKKEIDDQVKLGKMFWYTNEEIVTGSYFKELIDTVQQIKDDTGGNKQEE